MTLFSKFAGDIIIISSPVFIKTDFALNLTPKPALAIYG
jgi:hypothetical protein